MRSLPLAASVLVASSAFASPALLVGRGAEELSVSGAEITIARHGRETTLTFSIEIGGRSRDLAIVIPVPRGFALGSVRILESAANGQIDRRPHVREVRDSDPCDFSRPVISPDGLTMSVRARRAAMDSSVDFGGVPVVPREYHTSLLAHSSDELVAWLRSRSFFVPLGAYEELHRLSDDDQQFLVVEVHAPQAGPEEVLSPIQVRYDAERFSIPLVLGSFNSQDGALRVLTASPRGRVRVTNRETVRLGSDRELPRAAAERRDEFYRAAISHELLRHRAGSIVEETVRSAVLDADDKRQLGVDWDGDVWLTQFYLTAEIPDSLDLEETDERESFATEYVVRSPFSGEIDCNDDGKVDAEYRALQDARRREERRALEDLTGWHTGPSK